MTELVKKHDSDNLFLLSEDYAKKKDDPCGERTPTAREQVLARYLQRFAAVLTVLWLKCWKIPSDFICSRLKKVRPSRMNSLKI